MKQLLLLSLALFLSFSAQSKQVKLCGKLNALYYNDFSYGRSEFIDIKPISEGSTPSLYKYIDENFVDDFTFSLKDSDDLLPSIEAVIKEENIFVKDYDSFSLSYHEDDDAYFLSNYQIKGDYIVCATSTENSLYQYMGFRWNLKYRLYKISNGSKILLYSR